MDGDPESYARSAANPPSPLRTGPGLRPVALLGRRTLTVCPQTRCDVA